MSDNGEGREHDEPPDAKPDQFYRGTIEKLYQGTQMGVVRSFNGREIPFVFMHVIMVGNVRRFEDLHEGMLVGFDVGWTSRGLRVTVLRPVG